MLYIAEMLHSPTRDDKEQEKGQRRQKTQSQEPSRPFSPISSSAKEVNGAPGEHSLFPSSSPLFFSLNFAVCFFR